MHVFRISLCLVASALITGFGAVLAQQPTFTVSVNVVDVDVTVRDAQGNFVSGLSAEDFEVFEDGKPQKIETFSYIELPVERQERFGPSGRPVPVDVRSNRNAESGRVYIILLDDLNVAPLRTAAVRKHARDFIEQHLGPNDLAAVVVTSGRKDAAQEFTSDPALLLRAVDRFIGQRMQSAEAQRIDDYYQSLALSGLDTREQTGKDPQDEAVVPNLLTRMQSFDPSNQERGQRAVGVLNTLRSLTEYLEGVRGRRKALLWFSEGLDYPMSDVFSSNAGSDITFATRDAINAAARANVNVFSLDPRGLIGMTADFVDNMKAGAPDMMGTDPNKPVGTPYSGTQALLGEMRLTQDSLRTLADGTGGFAAVDTNSFDQAFSRIIDANSRYYLLGYAPPVHPRDGRFHRIEVRLKRPGLTAVARRGYPSPSGKTNTERKQDALERWTRERRGGGAGDTSPELRTALNNPVQQPGLTLAVHAAPFKGTAKDASVALAIELQGAELEFAPQSNGLLADTIEVSFFALNDDGRAQRGTRSALNLAVRPETYQRVKALGVRLNARTVMTPGRYQMRIGARDPNSGKAGTVFYDLTIPDFTREPVSMSGMLLAALNGPDMLTPQRDPASEKLLGAPATSRREFSQSETLAWLAEVYDNTPAGQAKHIDMRVRLISESGQQAFASSDMVANGAGGAEKWSTFAYTGRIPLKDVAPGRYLLTIESHDRAAKPERASAVQTALVVTP